jgi:hypothetical protein
MLQSVYFYLEGHRYGHALHVLIIMSFLLGGLIGSFYWFSSALIGIVLHLAYIKVYRVYKSRWDKREEILNQLMGDLEPDDVGGFTPRN